MSKEKKNVKKEVEDEIVTIRDFKAMIVGMDMIMGDDWTPDEKQWKRIRAKIDALLETVDSPNTHTFSSSVAPSVNVAEDELIRTFPAVPAVEAVPVGMQPTESALMPVPATPATPVAGSSENRVHRTDEFI